MYTDRPDPAVQAAPAGRRDREREAGLEWHDDATAVQAFSGHGHTLWQYVSPRSDVRHPKTTVLTNVVNNGVQFAWEAFFPLFAFTSTELGGLGLSVRLALR